MRPPRYDRLFAPAKRLILFSFLIDVGAACVLLAIQFRGKELAASPLMLGLLGTATFLIYVPLSVASGHLSDRFGRRCIAVFAAALALLAWVGMAFSATVWQLLALAVVSGSGLAILWPPVEAWLADLSGSSARVLNRNLGLFNLAWTAGLIIGPLVAGLAWASWHTNTFAAAALLASACLLVALLTPSAPPAQAHVAPPAHVEPRLLWAFLLVSWTGMVALAFGRGLMIAAFPNLGKTIGYSEPLIGLLTAILATGQGTTFFITRLTTRWQFRLWPLALAMVAGLMGMLVSGLTRHPAAFGAAFALVGGALGVLYMAGLTYAMQSAPERRGQRAGMHEAIMGIGLVTGPLLGGLAAQYINLQAPFLVGAGLIALALVAQVVVWGRVRALSRGRQAPQAGP